MAVDSVGTSGTINYVGSKTETSSGLSIDTNTFLTLLVAQLKYQDPLEPQKDTAFVTQLAQMTTLEQMQQMNTTLQSSQAFDMVGKYIYAEVLDTETGITNGYAGYVDSVIIKDGVPYVVVGETAIAISDVLQVFDPALTEISDEPETEEVEQMSETEETSKADTAAENSADQSQNTGTVTAEEAV
jgi:flagellar basal-body rod modification protein FlgD